MGENTTRLDRYAEALTGHWWNTYDQECECGWVPEAGQSGGDPELWRAHVAPLHMAVADAEQAELRAEIERLRKAGRNWHRSAMSNAAAAQRAEAKVARVEALLDNLAVPFISGGQRFIPSLRLTVGEVRAALDGTSSAS